MKLFKRTSITLLILIVIVWILVFVLVKSPSASLKVTDTEIEQTMTFLEKNNIKISENILKRDVSAVKCPDVIYRAKDRVIFASEVLGKECKKRNENIYYSEKTEIEFDRNEITVTGNNSILDGMNLENAAEKAETLLTSLDLSKTDMSVHVYDTDKGYQIIFIPEYKGKSIFDCKINLTVWGQNSFRLTALPISFGKQSRKILPQSPCSALSEYSLSDSAKGTTVTEINLGYKIKNDILYPAWEIKSDNSAYYN